MAPRAPRRMTRSLTSASAPANPADHSSNKRSAPNSSSIESATPKRIRDTKSTVAESILKAEKNLSASLSTLKFSSPVTHVYNPLEYAWDAHAWYVRKYADSSKKVLLLGMNPGPWGMAQTGVPFGEVSAVKEWMQMPPDVVIGKPEKENSQRPITGLSCTRSEVSGRRLWLEWAKAEYGDNPHDFFNTFFVHNYCPLMFMESSGRNRTPVQLPAKEKKELLEQCDAALRAVVASLKPKLLCGVGGFATDRCKKALAREIEDGLVLGTVLHPSPASPIANRGWVPQAKKQIEDLLAKIDA